ncbi:MAG: hypothetical protein JO356_02590 [Acidobacteria bacterium]|nr:hypothetical protein [Acidobacteriota bacterium]
MKIRLLRASMGALALALFWTVQVESQSTTELTPADLIKAVVRHELSTPNDSEVHWKYLLYKEVDGKIETREVVETSFGTLDRLIAVAGRPLTDAEQRTEADRIFHFSHDPKQQRTLQESRRKDFERCKTFLNLIPEAFVFQNSGAPGRVEKIAFRPNPQFRPMSIEGKVLHEMTGEVSIDTREQRLISIEGEMQNEVKFGAGFLGHLEKGGRFTVRRAEIAAGEWEQTDLIVNMRGKVLLFKNLSVQQKERRANFERLPPNLSIADAAGILLKQTLVASKR